MSNYQQAGNQSALRVNQQQIKLVLVHILTDRSNKH